MVSPLKPREIAAFLQSNQLLVRGVYEDGHVAPATKRTVMAAALGCADVGADDGWSVGTRRLVGMHRILSLPTKPPPAPMLKWKRLLPDD